MPPLNAERAGSQAISPAAAMTGSEAAETLASLPTLEVTLIKRSGKKKRKIRRKTRKSNFLEK